jgi:hypothetical protein
MSHSVVVYDLINKESLTPSVSGRGLLSGGSGQLAASGLLALSFLSYRLWVVFPFGLLTSTYDVLDLSGVNVLEELGWLLLLVISAKGLLLLLPLS